MNIEPARAQGLDLAQHERVRERWVASRYVDDWRAGGLPCLIFCGGCVGVGQL
jgi:hypothetical protein